jgi:transcriptional regulator with XRE-family HTH domain
MYENRLKEVRESRHMTQIELEKLSGISRVTISNIERGTQKDLKASTMVALANALNVSVSEIFLP